MFLLEGDVLSRVMSVYAVFWVVVIVGLFFAVGALIKKAERQAEKSRRAAGGGH